MLVWMAGAATADKRVALVVGNGAYSKVAKLPNPSRDAAAIERMLRAAAFNIVEVKQDLGTAAMRRALRDFSDHVRDADIAVVFFAGHGIEVGGTNYLVPVDATLERDIDVEDEAVSLERVTQILEPARRLRLVILDACRDNPFVRSMRRTTASRSIGRGLAKIDLASSDTLIAFAAKHGSTAADGDGSNSPYTSALVKHLATPGLDVRLALGRVRDEVFQTTASRQEPFLYGSLGGSEIALVPAQPARQPKATEPGEIRPRAQPFVILAQASWDGNCKAKGLPLVSITQEPLHGQITFGEGVTEITHVIGEDKRCLGTKLASRTVSYVPTDTRSRVDFVSLTVLTHYGERINWECAIRIGERKADCQVKK